MRFLRFILVLCLSEALIYTPLLRAQELSLPSGDLIAPVVKHDPITKTVDAGTSQSIRATVTDNVGVQSVILFYRTIGATEYDRLTMKRTLGTDEYSVELKEIPSPGIEYYVQATDLAGNSLLRGYSFSPLTLKAMPKAPVEVAKETSAIEPTAEKSGKKKPNWLLIGLGVLAVGAVAALAGGGGGGGGGTTPDPSTGSLSITAPAPASQ